MNIISPLFYLSFKCWFNVVANLSLSCKYHILLKFFFYCKRCSSLNYCKAYVSSRCICLDYNEPCKIFRGTAGDRWPCNTPLGDELEAVNQVTQTFQFCLPLVWQRSSYVLLRFGISLRLFKIFFCRSWCRNFVPLHLYIYIRLRP